MSLKSHVAEHERRTPVCIYRTWTVTLGRTHTHNGAPLNSHNAWPRQDTHTLNVDVASMGPTHTCVHSNPYNWEAIGIVFLHKLPTLDPNDTKGHQEEAQNTRVARIQRRSDYTLRKE